MKRLLLLLFLILSLAQLAKQDGSPVIIFCRNPGDGMEYYSSGFYMAMKFKQLGCKVYLAAVVPMISIQPSIEEEIPKFYKVFEP